MGLMTAGGCTLGGILASFHVGKSAAKYTIVHFFEAVVLSKVGEIKFPSTIAELQSAADAFFAKSNFCSLFYGHIGALDGLAVRIPMPNQTETDNPMGFRTRKGFAAVNAQAIADAKEKCIFLSVQTDGSTHDSTAWSCSSIHDLWRDEPIIDPCTGRAFWLSLDDAYAASLNQLPPWPGTGLKTRALFKDSFNYFLSGCCRNVVERMFGQVHQRFGLLWRPIRFPLASVPTVVMAIFQLHNFLKEMREADMPDVNTGFGARQHGELLRAVNVTNGYDHDCHPSDTCSTEVVQLPRVRAGQCPIREEIMEALGTMNMARPEIPELQAPINF